MADFFSTLMPLPRVCSAREGDVGLAGRVTLAVAGCDDAQAADLRRLAALVFDAWLAPDGVPLRVRLDPAHAPAELAGVAEPLCREAYELVIGEGQITLTAAQVAGLQRGVQTVKQLLENAEDAGCALPACRIVDWPRLAHRGIHYDFARELEYRHEHVKSVIARIAYFKMNTFHLYLEGIFAYPSAPEITPPCPLTPAHARELVEYARLFGVTLVPQMATLGHMGMLLNGPYEELREEPDSAFNLCPTHPRARPFLAGLIKDIAEAFTPRYIHLGYDESHSGHCARCRQHGAPEDLLVEHLNWMNAEVKKHGARAMIYGDKFLSAHDFPEADALNGGTPATAHAALSRISRDIIITDWHYTAPQSRTFGYLAAQGFEVHLASATNIYWHDAIPFHRGHHWVAETIDHAVAQGVSGAFNCNWEFYRGAFFENFWFFQGLAAERQWSDHAHDFLTFPARFAKRFWGVERDYYAEIAGLLEATPTQRRALFLDCSVFADGGPMQAKLDYVGLADYLDGQIAAFRRAARRNGESLRMLDMLTLIVRYLGTRMRQIAISRLAFSLGDKARGIAALEAIKTVAQQVGDKLEEGYRVYGGAVKDRARLQTQLEEIDCFIRAGDPCEWHTFRAYRASALQPKTAPVADAPLPDAALAFSGIMNVHLTEMADVRALHCGADGLLYLQTSVDFAHDFAGRLLYGADGPVKVWVNGEAVDCRPDATNPCTADEYACPVHWRAGRNEVLFALDTNHGKAWGLCARTASAELAVR